MSKEQRGFTPKFTPGPWLPMAGLPTNVIATSGIRVARCDFDGDATHVDCLANAHLIASAPDLYEACKEFLYAPEYKCDECDHGFSDEEYAAIVKMKAAIAKAEGHEGKSVEQR